MKEESSPPVGVLDSCINRSLTHISNGKYRLLPPLSFCLLLLHYKVFNIELCTPTDKKAGEITLHI